MMIRAAALAILLASPAGACVIDAYEDGHAIPAITTGPDCSYTLPGPEAFNTDISATGAVDLGGGRVGQRITRGFGCGYDEFVQVVDCNSRSGVILFGVRVEDMNQSRRADLLYDRNGGGLRLTPETEIIDILAVAVREGYDYQSNLNTWLDEIAPWGRPNLFCGCQVFYPGSAGATQ
jgi:hypothetical protein